MVVREDRATRPLLPAVAAGLVAAVATGVAWGLVVKWSEYEIGFAAWGVGFVVGFAVALAAGGARGLPYQIVAVACALLGILLGKYLSFVWVIQDVSRGFVDLPLFSADTIDVFWAARRDVFGWIDLLWAGLAVFTAWRALAPDEAEAPAGDEAEHRPPAADEQEQPR